MKEMWIEKNECTGCEACSSICPVKAIQMKRDEIGFLYPEIKDGCIDCGLCEKVCKNRLKKQDNCFAREVYAAWSKDEENRLYSTSGGLFFEISNYTIRNGGVVVAAKYNKNNLVEHTMVNTVEKLKELRQSKYVQSEIGNSFCKIKEQLDKEVMVTFCGTPCQVSGLKSFLGKEYSNLLLLEFICRGVNSPKAYEKWLEEIEEDEKSKANKVWFKYKVNGWKNSPRCIRIDFDNGTKKVLSGYDNKYMSGYLDLNLYMRPSCANCDFKGTSQKGDIILADFWGIEGKLDDDKGTSLVVINSLRGKRAFECVKENISCFKRDYNEISLGNVCFNNSVTINKDSEKFLKEIDKQKFSIALKKYERKRNIQIQISRIKNKLKRMFKL